MKKKMLTLCLFSIGMLLCSCGTNDSSKSINNSSKDTSSTSSYSSGESASSSEASTSSSQSTTSKDTTIHVTSVSLSKDSISIEEEKTLQLYEYVRPYNATDSSVTWSTSDSSVATVSNLGLVTGIKKGSATIKVRTTDGGFEAACNVTVLEKTIFEYEVGESTVKVLQNAYGKRLMCYTPITNKGNVNIYMSSCSYTVEDKDGNLVQSISSYNVKCNPDIIQPGETIICHGEYSYSGSLGEEDLVARPTVTIKNASGYDAKRLDVSDLQIRRIEYNQIEIIGKIRNNTEKTATTPYVGYFVYDADDNFVFADSTLLLDDLGAGQEASFNDIPLGYSYFESLDVSTCRVEAIGYDMQYVFIY